MGEVARSRACWSVYAGGWFGVLPRKEFNSKYFNVSSPWIELSLTWRTEADGQLSILKCSWCLFARNVAKENKNIEFKEIYLA